MAKATLSTSAWSKALLRDETSSPKCRNSWRARSYLRNCIDTTGATAVVVEYYGGAASRVPRDATAFPHRDLPWDILFVAQWTDPDETHVHRAWARAGEEVLRPFSANAHVLSALDVEAEEVIYSAFGDNLQRLAAVKDKYDLNRPGESGDFLI